MGQKSAGTAKEPCYNFLPTLSIPSKRSAEDTYKELPEERRERFA